MTFTDLIGGFICPVCDGQGMIGVEDDQPATISRMTCPPCHGTGRVTFRGMLIIWWTILKLKAARLMERKH